MRKFYLIVLGLSLSLFIFLPIQLFAQANWFQTGQDAYIILSAIGFNDTGGSLLFNHPMNIASDGTRLLLADTRNNRILIWNSLPGGNVEPDIVLGQENFTTNGEGTSLSQLNWPVGVATAEGKVIVADTYNDRILIWNSFPSTDNQAYDYYMSHPRDPNQMMWGGVKTSGGKFVTVATPGIAIWNSVPTSVVPPDLFVAGGSNYNDIFIMGGKQEVQIWTDNLPLSGNLSDITFKDQT